MPTPRIIAARIKLMQAAMQRVRAKGYNATTVDDICRDAGVTKGSFFHHFKSKDELALATIRHWHETTEALFAAAAYHKLRDPLDRLLAYVDLRAQMLTGELHEYTCLLGALVQETYETHPAIRAACERGLSSHVAALTSDILAAKQRYAPSAPWSAESVGYFVQSAIQGSFIYAKAKHSAELARANLEHLHRYLIALFPRRRTPRTTKA